MGHHQTRARSPVGKVEHRYRKRAIDPVKLPDSDFRREPVRNSGFVASGGQGQVLEGEEKEIVVKIDLEVRKFGADGRPVEVADVDQEELLVGKIPDRKNVPEKPESLALVSVVDDDDVDVFVGFDQVGRLSLILIEERGRNRF